MLASRRRLARREDRKTLRTSHSSRRPSRPRASGETSCPRRPLLGTSVCRRALVGVTPRDRGLRRTRAPSAADPCVAKTGTQVALPPRIQLSSMNCVAYLGYTQAVSIYISGASLLLSTMTLIWSMYQWNGSGGRPKVTLHYGMLDSDDKLRPAPWPYGQGGQLSEFGVPMLVVTVVNTGRDSLLVTHVEVEGTICGVCGPRNQGFPTRVEPKMPGEQFHFPPVAMGFLWPSEMEGKCIRAKVYYDIGKTARSNALTLGKQHRHSIKAKSYDLGPPLPPSTIKL